MNYREDFTHAALDELFPNNKIMNNDVFLSADTFNGILQIEYKKQFLLDPIEFYNSLDNLADNTTIYTWLSFDDEMLYKKIVKEYGINNEYQY